MDIGGDILIGIFLLFVLGTLFRFGLPIISGPLMILLEKLKKLGIPSWIYWTLGSIVVWGGVILCIFLVAIFADKFFGW